MKIAPGTQVDWTKIPKEFGGTQTENPRTDRVQQFLDARLGSIKQKKRAGCRRPVAVFHFVSEQSSQPMTQAKCSASSRRQWLQEF